MRIILVRRQSLPVRPGVAVVVPPCPCTLVLDLEEKVNHIQLYQKKKREKAYKISLIHGPEDTSVADNNSQTGC